MYCRNCGKEIADQAVICVACGVPPKSGKKFCQYCGSETSPIADICLKCGVKLATEGRDWLAALLLCIFLGYLGIHRFYTGHIAIGIIQLLTFGGCYIWVLIDLIMILTNTYKDYNGNLLVKNRYL